MLLVPARPLTRVLTPVAAGKQALQPLYSPEERTRRGQLRVSRALAALGARSRERVYGGMVRGSGATVSEAFSLHKMPR